MNFGQELCIKAKLVAKRTGIYTTYVFEDIHKTNSYIMCTRCPNWATTDIDIFQEGFLTYKYVIAGIDSWLDKNNTFKSYQYTANYFTNFIPITHVLNNTVVEELIVC